MPSASPAACPSGKPGLGLPRDLTNQVQPACASEPSSLRRRNSEEYRIRSRRRRGCARAIAACLRHGHRTPAAGRSRRPASDKLRGGACSSRCRQPDTFPNGGEQRLLRRAPNAVGHCLVNLALFNVANATVNMCLGDVLNRRSGHFDNGGISATTRL